MKNKEIKFPADFQEDIRRAVEILKKSGCTDIFLFGSLIEGKIRDGSDIDIAIRGCPRGKFFYLLGKLLLALDRSIDLVNLDSQDAFARYLEKEGRLFRIG
ncbi:MAG: nucleotidyltransferase domain-containing protein [bacterium]